MIDSIFKSPLADQEFTAFDLETSGLRAGEHEILEIAAVRFNKNAILNTFQSLCKPEKKLSPEAQIVNGLSLDVLKNARPLDEVLPEFINFFKGSILVIQNSDFDLGFLGYETEKRILSIPPSPVFCTLQLSRKIFPEFPKHGLKHLRNFLKIGPYKKDRGPSSIHEALDDSYAAMEVFKACIENKNLWHMLPEEAIIHDKGYKYTFDYIKQQFLF